MESGSFSHVSHVLKRVLANNERGVRLNPNKNLIATNFTSISLSLRKKWLKMFYKYSPNKNPPTPFIYCEHSLKDS